MSIRFEYSPAFYAGQVQGSISSAGRVVPLIIEILHPSSVLDVGCGLGGWLAEFSQAGCRVLGVDGNYIEQSSLKIPRESFVSADLDQCAQDGHIPGLTGQRFSLCLSLEVAEHLEAERADNFVQLLTRYSDRVLFSAAIPHQGGSHHVNEQWPDYWITRFAAHGYEAQDVLRPLIWEDKAIQPWYRQNLVLFVKRGCDLPFRDRNETRMPMRVVHPDFYLRCVGYYKSQEHLRYWPSTLLIGELMARAAFPVIFLLRNPLQWCMSRLKNIKRDRYSV